VSREGDTKSALELVAKKCRLPHPVSQNSLFAKYSRNALFGHIHAKELSPVSSFVPQACLNEDSFANGHSMSY
jgi:hypothetical protein